MTNSERAAQFEFPLLAFYRTEREPENERFFEFSNHTELNTATRDAAAIRPGMIVIDNSGHSRELRSLRFGRVITPWWSRVLCELLGQSGSIEHEVEQQFVELEPLSLDEVKARVCASLERNKDDWADYDGAGGEEGPLDESELIGKAKAAVQHAGSIAEIFEGMDAAWPY